METIRKLFKNSNFAQTRADKIASSVFVLGGIFTMWYEVNILLYYYQDNVISFMPLVHLLIAIWLYIGAMTNWYKLISTRTFGYYIELQPKQQHHWRYCNSCFSFYPPRAHHCKICGVCILKRDHHCWFAGCCVGYQNHRYYLSMLLYIFIAALYCNVFNCTFVMDKMEGFSMGTVLCMAFPHAGVLLGYLSLVQFCLCLVSLSGFVCLIMFTWLIQIQTSQLINGRTKYEMKKEDSSGEYHLSFKGNLEEVMGKCYHLAWICPWISSQLPGDGITFEKQQHKDQ